MSLDTDSDRVLPRQVRGDPVMRAMRRSRGSRSASPGATKGDPRCRVASWRRSARRARHARVLDDAAGERADPDVTGIWRAWRALVGAGMMRSWNSVRNMLCTKKGYTFCFHPSLRYFFKPKMMWPQ